MTLNRRPVPASLKRPSDRVANACLESAVGVPAQGPDDQLQHALLVPRPGGHREWRPTASSHAPIAHEPIIGAHSTPIARAPGGAV